LNSPSAEIRAEFRTYGLSEERRVNCLESFAVSLLFWVCCGHFVLGFEGPWIYTPVMIATTLSTAVFLETIDAWLHTRVPRFLQSPLVQKGFFLPPFISGLNGSMLIYSGESLSAPICAAVLSVCSKLIFRVRLESGRLCHYLNPSNFGLCFAFYFFPATGSVPPYQYTATEPTLGEIIVPVIGITYGLLLNKMTGRLPLVLSYHLVFILQAALRCWLETPGSLSPLYAMTGPAFILFSLYMIPDPGTTPFDRRNQIIFGASVALIYAIFQQCGIVYGPFYALLAVNLLRGVIMARTGKFW
jgi:enediyne biosynthesis protein E5